MRQAPLVSDWMYDDPVTIGPDATLIEAYETMQTHDVRRLPVVDDDGELLGIITESDIQRAQPYSRLLESDSRAIEDDPHLGTIPVRRMMAADPEFVAPDDSIQTAAERMVEFEISGLRVVDGDHVVGIITESDIFQLVVRGWATGGNAGAVR